MEHWLCVVATRSCVEHAIYAGEMLVEAKGQALRGGWGGWLEENFNGSQGRAQAYMRIARNREVLEANPQRPADMTLQEALREIRF